MAKIELCAVLINFGFIFFPRFAAFRLVICSSFAFAFAFLSLLCCCATVICSRYCGYTILHREALIHWLSNSQSNNILYSTHLAIDVLSMLSGCVCVCVVNVCRGSSYVFVVLCTCMCVGENVCVQS